MIGRRKNRRVKGQEQNPELTRNKRRLTLLALALGLIAAAPYLFRAVADTQPQFDIFGAHGGPMFSSVPYVLPNRIWIRARPRTLNAFAKTHGWEVEVVKNPRSACFSKIRRQ